MYISLLTQIRSEIQKKEIENDQLTQTNSQLEKNYEDLNNQLILYQTKVKQYNIVRNNFK